jgi:hypothetical protein
MAVDVTEAVLEGIAKANMDIRTAPLQLEGPSYHMFPLHFLAPFLLLTPAFILHFSNRKLATLTSPSIGPIKMCVFLAASMWKTGTIEQLAPGRNSAIKTVLLAPTVMMNPVQLLAQAGSV